MMAAAMVTPARMRGRGRRSNDVTEPKITTAETVKLVNSDPWDIIAVNNINEVMATQRGKSHRKSTALKASKNKSKLTTRLTIIIRIPITTFTNIRVIKLLPEFNMKIIPFSVVSVRKESYRYWQTAIRIQIMKG